MSNLRRFLETTRHLKPGQVAGRLFAGPRRLLAIWRSAYRNLKVHSLPAPVVAGQHDPWNSASEIAAGNFTFLGEKRAVGSPPLWNLDAPLLWQFNLHYFGYLHLMNPDDQRTLCLDWIRANPPSSKSTAWHPYPTSIRIVNWCRSLLDDPAILASLARQVDYLHRNTEIHIMGNHLLENARALVVAGEFFGRVGAAGEWFEHGLRLFRDQTREQIFPDGAHFERSPMYQAILLEGYLDLIAILGNEHEETERYRGVVKRMLTFLYSMVLPDGTLSMFNDTAQEIGPSIKRIRSYAKHLGIDGWEMRAEFPNAGYYIGKTSSDIQVFIDGGAIGPDYLPAHAHADIFSYELAVGGGTFVADTGVYTYESGPDRDFARSTAAHSTVTVDGVSQAEVWSSFRVARRFAPHDVSFRREENGFRFDGTFSGYSELIGDGITHQRTLWIDNDGIRVADRVSGSGRHEVLSRITLHPDVVVRQEGLVFELERDGVVLALILENGTLVHEAGWYSERFGVRVPRKVICVSYSGELPASLKYRLMLKS